MFVDYTFQDWESADHRQLIPVIIDAYKQSADFRRALTAKHYYDSHNEAVEQKQILKADSVVRKDDKERTVRTLTHKAITGNQIANGFFKRAVLQQVSFLLANGVFLPDGVKERLGIGFDHALSVIGRNAIVEGVCWGFFNADHIEVIEAARDAMSGFVALADEMTGAPAVGIQFWQISPTRPQYIRLFESDGITMYSLSHGELTEIQPKRAYVQLRARDAAGEMILGGSNYSALPVVPMYANDEHQSELTPAIKSKIDAYDRIISDLGDNLDRANDVYWVLNNFGGSTDRVLEMLEQINKIKAVANQTDGTGSGSSAEPHTIEVPYEARQTALDLLRKGLFSDYMALDMDTLRGGSLTNVAIEAATADLNLKADHFEWQAFQFVQAVLRLIGVQTEGISFKRQTIANASEIVQDLYMFRSDVDRRTALEKNPYIDQDEIDGILANLDAEGESGMGMEELETELQRLREQVAAQGGEDEPEEDTEE